MGIMLAYIRVRAFCNLKSKEQQKTKKTIPHVIAYASARLPVRLRCAGYGTCCTHSVNMRAFIFPLPHITVVLWIALLSAVARG